MQTANLDGETDLKTRSALQETAKLRIDPDIQTFRGVVECAPPNPELYKFNSRMKVACVCVCACRR